MNQPRRRPRSRAASRAQTGRGLRNGPAGWGSGAAPALVACRPAPEIGVAFLHCSVAAAATAFSGSAAAAARSRSGGGLRGPLRRRCHRRAEAASGPGLRAVRGAAAPSPPPGPERPGRVRRSPTCTARSRRAGPLARDGAGASAPSWESAPPPPQPGRGWAQRCREPPALAGDAGGDAEGGRADRWGRRRCAPRRPRDAAAPVLVARARRSARRLCELRRERERDVALCRPRRPGRAASDSGRLLPPSVQRPGRRAADAHWAAEGTRGTWPPCSAPVWRAGGSGGAGPAENCGSGST